MDNKQNEIKQDDLVQVAGGEAGITNRGQGCYFKPTGKRKIESGFLWMECSSHCGLTPIGFQCFCHGKDQCVNKWHKMDENDELYHQDWGNHRSKTRSNNYDSGGFSQPAPDPIPGPK